MALLPETDTTKHLSGGVIGRIRNGQHPMLVEFPKEVVENAANCLGRISLALVDRSEVDANFHLPVIVLAEMECQITYKG